MSRRTGIIGGASLAAIAIVVVLIVVSIGGGDSPANEREIRGVTEAVALTKGLPQSGYSIGTASAPVTVREFIDPQCAICKKAAVDTLPPLIKGPVRAGTARVILVPLTFIGPDSATAAQAIGAAAAQGRAWPYTEILYANQGAENSGWATDDLLTRIAGTVPGLDVARWKAARTTDAVASGLFHATDLAKEQRVNATPTFVVTGPGGRQVLSGAVLPQALLDAVKAVS